VTATDLTDLVAEIRELRHPEPESEWVSPEIYEGRDGVFWYRLSLHTNSLKVAIRSHASGRWCADTDFIWYNPKVSRLAEFFRWCNTRLELEDYSEGWGMQLEFGQSVTRRTWRRCGESRNKPRQRHRNNSSR
jgi:hypothetical protein